ncbi:MAG: hypothetical protein JST59_02595 [Actinobacteria bacterium]|nr:hypothetical protein [Actinomycetota bacterium]
MFVKVQRGQTIKKIRLQGAPTIEQLLAPFRCMKLIEGGSEKGYSLALDNSEVLINNDEQLQHLLARSESSGGSGTIKLRITDHSSRPTSNRTSEEYEVVPNMEVRPGGSFVRNQTNRKMSDSTHEWKARGHYHSEEVQLPS